MSTDQQELDAQKVGVGDYAAGRKLRIDHWVTETVSGTVAAAERELGKLVPKLRQGHALLVPELSRLGRSTVDVLTTVKALRDRGVAVHVVKGAFVLGDDMNSKILSTALGLAAEIERELLQQRVKEGLARAKAAPASTSGGRPSSARRTAAASSTSTRPRSRSTRRAA